MTAVHTVPAVTAALIAEGVVTVITAAERGIDGRILIRAGEYQPFNVNHPNYPQIGTEWWSGSRVLARKGDGPDKWIKVHTDAIVASGTVAWTRIKAETVELAAEAPHFCLVVGGLLHSRATLYAPPNVAEGVDWDHQLPYGDFTPGRWAGILTDVKATTDRCPACWGYSHTFASDSHPDGSIKWERTCQRCGHEATCPPIPCDDVKEWP